MSGIPSDGPHQLDTRSQALEEPVCALLWASEDEEELPGAFGGDVLSPAHQGLCGDGAEGWDGSSAAHAAGFADVCGCPSSVGAPQHVTTCGCGREARAPPPSGAPLPDAEGLLAGRRYTAPA